MIHQQDEQYQSPMHSISLHKIYIIMHGIGMVQNGKKDQLYLHLPYMEKHVLNRWVPISLRFQEAAYGSQGYQPNYSTCLNTIEKVPCDIEPIKGRIILKFQ